jgi:hypothetical protein
MDAFLYASAKIIVFNKRAQQIKKYKMGFYRFQRISEMKHPFLFWQKGVIAKLSP